MPPLRKSISLAAPCGPSLSGHLEKGGHARAGKRPVSEYGPGARRGQPGEVLGLPDQRMLPARSETASELSPLSSLLTFESLLLRIFGRRQERRQCSAHRFFAGKAARDIAGQRHRARVPEICRGLDVGDIGKCPTLARSLPAACKSCLFGRLHVVGLNRCVWCCLVRVGGCIDAGG